MYGDSRFAPDIAGKDIIIVAMILSTLMLRHSFGMSGPDQDAVAACSSGYRRHIMSEE